MTEVVNQLGDLRLREGTVEFFDGLGFARLCDLPEGVSFEDFCKVMFMLVQTRLDPQLSKDNLE